MAEPDITVILKANGDPKEIQGKACQAMSATGKTMGDLVAEHGPQVKEIAPGIFKLGRTSCYIYIGGKKIWVCG